jgi:hypothetical protein
MSARVAAALLSSLLLTSASCADRERPLPFLATMHLDLRAEVLTPRSSDLRTVPAGGTIEVRIYAEETGGNLHGVGFVARRWTAQNGDQTPAVDSSLVLFPAKHNVSHSFALRVPREMPHNAQLDIFGIAVGPLSTETVLSYPAAITVLQCVPGAIWC